MGQNYTPSRSYKKVLPLLILATVLISIGAWSFNRDNSTFQKEQAKDFEIGLLGQSYVIKDIFESYKQKISDEFMKEGYTVSFRDLSDVPFTEENIRRSATSLPEGAPGKKPA